ncbi:hypothetical protein AAC387_Pa09g0106 [Persea americana]
MQEHAYPIEDLKMERGSRDRINSSQVCQCLRVKWENADAVCIDSKEVVKGVWFSSNPRRSLARGAHLRVRQSIVTGLKKQVIICSSDVQKSRQLHLPFRTITRQRKRGREKHLQQIGAFINTKQHRIQRLLVVKKDPFFYTSAFGRPLGFLYWASLIEEEEEGFLYWVSLIEEEEDEEDEDPYSIRGFYRSLGFLYWVSLILEEEEEKRSFFIIIKEF